jgi:hypothetical protein
MRLIKTYLTLHHLTPYFLWILNSTHHFATIQMWFDATIMQILLFWPLHNHTTTNYFDCQHVSPNGDGLPVKNDELCIKNELTKVGHPMLQNSNSCGKLRHEQCTCKWKVYSFHTRNYCVYTPGCWLCPSRIIKLGAFSRNLKLG